MAPTQTGGAGGNGGPSAVDRAKEDAAPPSTPGWAPSSSSAGPFTTAPSSPSRRKQACGWTTEVLADAGFEVDRGAAGMETAFVAEAGSGPMVLGICAEYDALPGDRSCLRSQPHRRVGRGSRNRAARLRRRARTHRCASSARRPRRAAAARSSCWMPASSRGPRGDDGPPVAVGLAGGHLPRRLALRRDLPWPCGPRLGIAVRGHQRRRRHGRRPGRPSASCASSCHRATRSTAWSPMVAAPPTSSRRWSPDDSCADPARSTAFVPSSPESPLASRPELWPAGPPTSGPTSPPCTPTWSATPVCSPHYRANADGSAGRSTTTRVCPDRRFSTDMANVSLAVPTIHPLIGLDVQRSGQSSARVRGRLRDPIGGEGPARRRRVVGVDGHRRGDRRGDTSRASPLELSSAARPVRCWSPPRVASGSTRKRDRRPAVMRVDGSTYPPGRYSPKTPRRTSETSPSVAMADSADFMGMSRFWVPRAAASTSARAASTAD